MRPRGRVRFSLTNRLLLLAAAIVVVTTLLLIGTSAAGVYQMAGRQKSAREAAYRDILATELSGHLDGAESALGGASQALVAAGGDDAARRQALANVTLANAQYLEGMALIGADGAVLVEWPPDTTGASASALGSSEQSSVATEFIWEAATDVRAAGTLWAVLGVQMSDDQHALLAGRVRMTSIERTTGEISTLEGAPTALVFDSAGDVVFHSPGWSLSQGSAIEFIADATQGDTGEVRIEGDEAEVGSYAHVASPKNLGWRVAVVEPSQAAWRETVSALMPGLLGYLLALVLALAASLAVVTRVTRPLRALERRARALASGASVAPQTVVGHDEVGRLLDAFNSVAQRLSRLNEVAELLARASDRTLVLSGVTSSIVHMLGTVDAEVLVRADDGRAELVAAEGALAGSEGASFDLGEVGWIASALDSEAPIVVKHRDDAFFALHGADASSALAAPLRAGSHTVGLAVVVKHGGVEFTEAETETVRSFAAQASVALQNSRLFEEERSSREDAESLRIVAERVAEAGPLDETLLDIARMEAELLGGGRPLILLREHAIYGLPPAVDPATERVWFAAWEAADTDGAGGAVFLGGPDTPDECRRALDVSGADSALVTPLRRSAELAGLLVLLDGGAAQAPPPRRMALAGTVGRQASLALENAYLYQQARSRADNLETIFRISHAVGSSLQTRIVLNRVLDVVQKILSADAVMLMTYDAQRKSIGVPMARGILHRDMLEASFRPGEDVPGRVFETREPERFDRIASADTRLLNLAAEQGLQSLLAVPLLARGRSIGVLVVFSREEGAFSTDELDLLRTFASQAALAIDTAEMFSREHSVSTTLQESILPTRLPRIDRIDASSVYLPAGTDADIGGDYYDLFSAPDGRVVVSIGDVCGKGVAAATKTSMIRYALRGMVVAGLEPARVLAELNAMLLEAADATSIVTLWLGYIDTAEGTILYADGGHPPGLLLCPENRRIERLGTTGALLGAVADTQWGQRLIDIAAGSMLLLYTDGVTEARSGARFFGEGRVRRALRAGGSAASVAQRLLGQVQRFAAGELRDDAAILAVGYTSEVDVMRLDDSGK